MESSQAEPAVNRELTLYVRPRNTRCKVATRFLMLLYIPAKVRIEKTVTAKKI